MQIRIYNNRRLIEIICVIFISLFIFQSAYAMEEKTSKKINALFLGNSFTYAADVPKIFKKLFDEGKSECDADVTTVAYGGSNLFMHWHIYRSQNIVRLQSLSKSEMETQIEELKNIPQDPPDLFLDEGGQKAAKIWGRRASKKSMRLVIKRHSKWLEMIGNTSGWDYVVLQSWKDMDKSKPNNFFKYASMFASLAKKDGAKVVLYITSPYSQNMKPVDKPACVERAFKDTIAAKEFAKEIDALVVPMPLAIYYAQQERPDITFRYVNNFHLNHNSAYLAACLMYAVVTNENPEGLMYNEVMGLGSKPNIDHDGNPRKQFIDFETRTYLQKLAWKTIQAFNNDNLKKELF